MEELACFECVATFRSATKQKKRVMYHACPLKAAYRDGLTAFEKEFGQSAEAAGFELAEIMMRDIKGASHQLSWFEEFDLDAYKAGRIDGCALNAYTLEQLKNPEMIP